MIEPLHRISKTEGAILDGLFAHLEDDAPKLIYADYVQEELRGEFTDEAATFIRTNPRRIPFRAVDHHTILFGRTVLWGNVSSLGWAGGTSDRGAALPETLFDICSKYTRNPIPHGQKWLPFSNTLYAYKALYYSLSEWAQSERKTEELTCLMCAGTGTREIELNEFSRSTDLPKRVTCLSCKGKGTWTHTSIILPTWLQLSPPHHTESDQEQHSQPQS